VGINANINVILLPDFLKEENTAGPKRANIIGVIRNGFDRVSFTYIIIPAAPSRAIDKDSFKGRDMLIPFSIDTIVMYSGAIGRI
jgi:hypothetical protein